VADTGQHNLQRRRKTGARVPEVIDRREEILQTAQKLFAEQGFRETNLNDVAGQLASSASRLPTTSRPKTRSSTN